MALTATANSTTGVVSLAASGLGVTEADIIRIDALGVETGVRNGEPAEVTGGSWSGDDYEGPLDEAVTYEARNTGTGAVIATSSPVTLASGGKVWLVHPGQPDLNVTLTVAEISPGTRKARSVALDVLDRSLPLGQSLRRSGYAGDLAVRVSTGAELEAIDAIISDGHVLVLRTPATWIGYRTRYVQIGDVDFTQLIRVPDGRFTIRLPWVEVERPAGISDTDTVLIGSGSVYLSTTIAITSAGVAEWS